ncbi:hypothetical protein CI109_106049 [Kwoniella shandongensis]|uniref:Large ribosomal subunit protein uL23m n=1 Tax=Kwoniella shandongensis TaxID=1734106 RepID=A0A5M6C334_9TREE|nr:uncharacterized protein CI109_003898 [Kwoniella shandongensis]KAA5527639.1 hypothetical protein CI109_003898 [Kwoniella shandongensis]
MSRIIRRAFSAFPPRAGPSTTPSPATLFPSASSVASTLPQAVRRRRAEHPPHPQSSASPLSDADLHDPTSGKKFPLGLEKEYQDLLNVADFGAGIDDASLRGLFLKGTAEWKSRVRGFAPRGRTGRHDYLLGVMGGKKLDQEVAQVGEGEEAIATTTTTSADPDQIVGQRIYLPNIQIRLMRNHTPPGQSYDPNIATFRIPPSMTKTDLRSYLLAVYNLKVSFIRTDNYIGEIGRSRTGEVIRKGGSSKTYKRAVVGLYEPFHYPDDMEELYAQGARTGKGDEAALARDRWLQENYSLRTSEEMRKRAMFKYYKGSRWRSRTHANLGNTVKEIMKRRKEREEKVTEEVKRRYAAIAQGSATGAEGEQVVQTA